MAEGYQSLSQQMETTRIDFYVSSGFSQLQEWRLQMETLGASVELGFLSAFLLTGCVATWNFFKRQQMLLHPRGALNFCVAAVCLMRVVLLADPFGWLGVLQPWLRSCLYAVPQAALATMLAYLVALWQRLSKDALAKDRVRSQWSLGRLASPFIVSSLSVCAAAVLTSVLGSNAFSVYPAQEQEAAGVAIVSLVRAIYGLYTLGITTLACIGMQRLLAAMSVRAQSTLELARLEGLPHASSCCTTARCWRTRTAPQSVHIVYRRMQAGFERQPVAIYKDGLQIADSSNVLDLAQHFANMFTEGTGEKGRSAPYVHADADPSVDKASAQHAHSEAQQYRSVRRKLLLACVSGLLVLSLWLTSFLYCCIIRYVNALEWLLYLAAEHAVELAGCWAVLFSVWPASRPGRDSFDQGKDGEGKEGSDKGFGQGGDWAPLRARGRAKLDYKKKGGKLDGKLKEVWEDETLLAYLAVSMGLRGTAGAGQMAGQREGDGAYSALSGGQDADRQHSRDPLRAAVSHVRDVATTIASGWRALLGLQDPTTRTNGQSSVTTAALPQGQPGAQRQAQTATVVANVMQQQPVPVGGDEDGSTQAGGGAGGGPADEDPSAARGRKSTVGGDSPPSRHASLAQPAPPSPMAAPSALPLAPGTVLTISLDTILSSPALRALLVDAQERELQSCAQDRQALLQATAAAIAQSAREAIAQMRIIQDAVLEQSSPAALHAPAEAQAQGGRSHTTPVTVYNPLRSLQPMHSTGSTGSEGASSTSTSPSGSIVAGSFQPPGLMQVQEEGGACDAQEAELPPLHAHTATAARSERGMGAEDGSGGLPPSLVQWLATQWPSDQAVQEMVSRTPSLHPSQYSQAQVQAEEEEGWVDMQSPAENGALVDLLVWAHGEERRRVHDTRELTASTRSGLQVRRRSLDSTRSHVRKLYSPGLAPVHVSVPSVLASASIGTSTSSTGHTGSLDVYRGTAPAGRNRAAAEKEIEMVAHASGPSAHSSPSLMSGRVDRDPYSAGGGGSGGRDVVANPLALLAKAMQEKDAVRRRERSKSRGVSMAEVRGNGDEGEGAWPAAPTITTTATVGRSSSGSGGSEGAMHGDGDCLTAEDEAEWLASPEGKESVRKERVLQMLANLKARGKALPPAREAELLRAMETQQRAGGVEGSLSARGQGSRAAR